MKLVSLLLEFRTLMPRQSRKALKRHGITKTIIGLP